MNELARGLTQIRTLFVESSKLYAATEPLNHSLLAYVASVVVRVASRVIALQPALSSVAATASSCESWMSSQIWSAQRRGGLPRGRRQEGGS